MDRDGPGGGPHRLRGGAWRGPPPPVNYCERLGPYHPSEWQTPTPASSTELAFVTFAIKPAHGAPATPPAVSNHSRAAVRPSRCTDSANCRASIIRHQLETFETHSPVSGPLSPRRVIPPHVAVHRISANHADHRVSITTTTTGCLSHPFTRGDEHQLPAY